MSSGAEMDFLCSHEQLSCVCDYGKSTKARMYVDALKHNLAYPPPHDQDLHCEDEIQGLSLATARMQQRLGNSVSSARNKKVKVSEKTQCRSTETRSIDIVHHHHCTHVRAAHMMTD